MGLGRQVFQSRLGFFTLLESTTTDVAFSVSSVCMSTTAIESMGSSALLMLSVCAWAAVIVATSNSSVASALRTGMCLNVFNVSRVQL